MDHLQKLKNLKSSCLATYPSLENYNFENTQNLIADFTISVNKKTITQIQDFVDTIFSLSRKPEYQNFILNKFPQYKKLIDAPNYSILMSYDFHIDENGQAKLIEINTNASNYLTGNEICKISKGGEYTQSLKQAFMNEFSTHDKPIKNIVIIDENPKDQFMYIEFLMFKDLFISWGYDCSILDYRDLKYDGKVLVDTNGTPVDFIYNRYCDFNLKDKSSEHLLNAYQNKSCLFSPNPKEYLLLADKNRMIEWNTDSWKSEINLTDSEIQILDNTLIPSQPIDQFNPEELWADKKNYFFKPTQSFGSKSVYRGKSISKKHFERLITADTLVQKFIPAPTINVDEQKWKYDLRSFVYKNKVHFTLARAYQGQVTNLQTLGGGLALVKIC